MIYVSKFNDLFNTSKEKDKKIVIMPSGRLQKHEPCDT